MFTLTCGGGWVPGSFAEKIAAAAALGYRSVEPLCWLGEDLRAARDAFDRTRCGISAILIQSADAETQRLISNDHGIVHEDARDAFVRAVGETLAAAQLLGTRNIVVTSGNERTEMPVVPRAVQHTNIVAALRAALPVIEGSGVTLVLEPLNALVNHQGYFLTTAAEGAGIIREVNSPQVKMLFDVYHQQITEGNLIHNIRAYRNEIGHFHVGDVPGRNEPGTGEINYRNVFRAIAATGYDGFVVFECGLTEAVETVTEKMFRLAEGLA
ncbi:MAG: TIM barrel protein [Oscillospiraceae bacterium]|jgi:hydroxypyruvate isomerase|nr:TIM barrel protein [Oscillospiraceae bacterium]